MAISKKFFVDIDLQGNGLNNSTVGANANMTKAGSFQYNAAETRLEYFNGSLVEQVANLSDISAVTGGLILQGAYDAATNTPDITDGNALKGYFWVVTVAGTFLGETVQVGDSIIAKVDEAGALLTDWLILQGNVVIATTEVAGITYLATQEQVNGGTETGAYAVTPATLQVKVDAAISTAEAYADSLAPNYDAAGSAATAQANAEAYADSLAPNYDPAGAAATAESNANTYTDTQIASKTYTQFISDWTLNDGVYSFEVVHGLEGFPTISMLEATSGNYCELLSQYVTDGTTKILSNILPTDTIIVTFVNTLN